MQNLVQSAMSLLLPFKTKRKCRKIFKNQTMFEKCKYKYFVVWGLNHWSKIYQNTQNNVFPLLFESYLPSIAKWYPLIVFSPVTYFN